MMRLRIDAILGQLDALADIERDERERGVSE